MAQESYLVSGKVISSEDKLGMPGVQVLASKSQGTVTSDSGDFELELSEETVTLQFRMIGFGTERVSVSSSKAMPLRIVLEPTVQLLDQVVISASRFEQNVAEVTVSMEVLNPQLIRNRNITALDDALKESPGMIIVDGEPQIRSGSGYSFGAGSRVQVLVDDVPQLSGDVGRPTWANIPMESVEQIEVIKGASSVLYGSAALSGIVHVRTAYPKADPETQISFYGGAYAKPRSESNRYWDKSNLILGQTVRHSQRLGNSDLLFSIDLLDDDGHLGPRLDSTGAIEPKFNPADASHYDAERRARAFIKYRYRNQKVLGLVYGMNLIGQKNASVATLLWDNTEDGLYKAFAGSATETKQTVSNVNPFIEYRSLKGYSLTWRGNWSNLDNANDNDQDNFSDTYFSEIQIHLNDSVLKVKGLRTTMGMANTWAESESELFSNRGFEPLHESKNLGLYLQADMALSKKLNVSAGVRWEQFEIDGDQESKPVFRAGLNYRAAEATYLRASFGQGYRFPTIGERYITTAVGVLNIYPNPELRSETSSNLEVGVKQGFAIGSFKGYADLAFFRQEFENYIEFTFGQWADTATIDNLLGLGFTSLNTGTAEVTGAELSIAAQGDIGANSSLSLLAGYTYTLPVSTSPDYVYATSTTEGLAIDAFQEVSFQSSSSDPSNDILKYRMQHIARLNADLQTGRFNLGVGIRYNSFMQNIDDIFEELDDGEALGGTLPSGVTQWRKDNNKGDIVLDMRMGYRFLDEHSFSIVIDNVANREYAIRPLALESTRRIVLKLSLLF